MATNSSPTVALRDWQVQTALLERQLTAFRALQRVTHSLTSELHLSQLLSLILTSAIEVVHADSGSLLLLDAATNELVFRVVIGGAGEALIDQRIPSDQGIAGWVLEHQEPVIVHDVNTDTRFLQKIDLNHHHTTLSLIAAPLLYQGRAIGVVEALNKKTGERFDDTDQEILAAFGAQSAIAIENAQLYEQVVAERDRILTTEEHVRREIARDLHDGPTQLLSAIIMGLQFLKEVVERRPELAREEIADLERTSTQALQQLRNLQFNLRPLVLETQGLRAGLEFFAERQRAAHAVAVYLEVGTFKVRFPARSEAAIFGIVQEAVNNAIKHAQAKNIWITAKQDPFRVTITVQDDGNGFDLESVEKLYAKRGSLGLLNMKERAQIAGGEFSIASHPGLGTLVSLEIPLILEG